MHEFLSPGQIDLISITPDHQKWPERIVPKKQSYFNLYQCISAYRTVAQPVLKKSPIIFPENKK